MYKGEAPLAQALFSYAEKQRASFHTPGHKGHASPLDRLRLLEHDLTELPDTGSLFDGDDVIEEAEKRAASAFGASETLFSAGGCTLCIQSMLFTGAGSGSQVLMARNAHRSAVNAAALLGLDPVWCWPEMNGTYHPITPGQIDEQLKKHNKIQSVYITSPDYYGNLCDIAGIAEVCRQHGATLLVDNAHGSHLGAFGRHPLHLGADMTADSAHKTLPVLTGGAYWHLSTQAARHLSRPAAKAAMALFGSTSPSFPVLASLDLARAWWEQEGPAAYRKTAEWAAAIRCAAMESAAAGQGLDVAFRELAEMDRDPARLTLRVPAGQGEAAASWFRLQGCEPEMADEENVVFILTPFNTQSEMTRLEKAVRDYRPLSNGSFGDAAFSPAPPPFRPEKVCTPREALRHPFEGIPVGESVGRIAARAVCPCPPGVAAVVPGERVDRQLAQWLLRRGVATLAVVK